jgi:CRP-like cAMP-binding protein
MQLVLLGAGAFIGDMTLLNASSIRSASVAALTEVYTLRISNTLFLRLVPQTTLDHMRDIVEQKEIMTRQHLQDDVVVRFAIFSNPCDI